MSDTGKVLTLYDVRGIQDYIFRTSKMKDAIGASHIVEELFKNALDEACNELQAESPDFTFDMKWEGEGAAKPFDIDDCKDLQVVYIGGGNACVIYKDSETATRASKIMANYTMENTYSLQLAAATVPVTGNYADDYAALNRKMTEVKDKMMVSKPMDALPIVDVETKTGFPLVNSEVSRESDLKKMAADEVRRDYGLTEKQFDSYVSDKGDSSMLAVVHIDGNNMGLRIRDLIRGIEDYNRAITEMRRISYTINTTYTKVYKDMEEKFNDIRQSRDDDSDNSLFWIMKVISAGDDITYVCNASIAFATVEYFLNNISKYSMKPGGDDEYKYRFSACAGISYFNSHFPFNIAYNVAEECCESAKSRAKEEDHLSDDGALLVANWVDFQFCRSVHTQNLEKVRAEVSVL